jgi:mRNA interferase RelE/StbE
LAWTIRLTDTARKQLAKLDPQIARRITKFLRVRLATADDPRILGRALKGEQLGESWRYRVGDYRILCDIVDAELVILALAIGHRREIYRE